MRASQVMCFPDRGSVPRHLSKYCWQRYSTSLYNDNQIPAEQMAQIGQYAENEYFGKPCGLMDQMACAVGGIIAIDFKDPENPEVKKVNFDFDREKFSLLVVDTVATTPT